jgi:hypothetical protein
VCVHGLTPSRQAPRLSPVRCCASGARVCVCSVLYTESQSPPPPPPPNLGCGGGEVSFPSPVPCVPLVPLGQDLLGPVSSVIRTVNGMKDRSSPFVNHLNAIAEGISAFQWVGIVRALCKGCCRGQDAPAVARALGPDAHVSRTCTPRAA